MIPHRPSGVILLVVLSLALAGAASADVLSRAVTIVRMGVSGGPSRDVASRSASLLGLAPAGAAANPALSRLVTLQNLGGSGPRGTPLGRLLTLQNLGNATPPFAPVIARAFTVSKDGGTTDVPPGATGSTTLTFLLHPASPNPVHRAARLEYELADERPVRLDLIDAGGRRVRTLVRCASQPAGRYVVEWDGTRDDGTPLRAGVYWLRLVAGSFDQHRKLVLLRD